MFGDIASVAIAGEWWRQLASGLDPTDRLDPPKDARWQRGEAVDAVYLADSPATAWAEWYRWLAESALMPQAGLPRDLWRVEVEIETVVDLRSTESLEAVGLSAPRPDRREWPAFQAVGGRLHAQGSIALAAPSAARNGGVVLCVFWPPANDVRVDHRSFERFLEAPVVPRGLCA